MTDPVGLTRDLVRDPGRWLITLGGIAVFGLGSRLWLPGLDPAAAAGLGVRELSADLSVFSVGARPILLGLALVEMARLLIPPLGRWVAADPRNSERFCRAARILALAIAAVQAMDIARAAEGLDDIAPDPGPMFRLGVVAAIVGATAFLIWLARVMTERGVGDGVMVLLAAPFVAHLPGDAAYGFGIVRMGLAPAWAPLALAVLVAAAMALLVASTRPPRGDGRLDIWPPLLGTIVLQALAVFFHLADSDSGDRFSAPVGANSACGPARRARRPHLALRRLAGPCERGRRRLARRRDPRLLRRAAAVARDGRRRADERPLDHRLRRRGLEHRERQGARRWRALRSHAHGLSGGPGASNVSSASTSPGRKGASSLDGLWGGMKAFASGSGKAHSVVRAT